MIKIHLLSFYRQLKIRLMIAAEEQKPPLDWRKEKKERKKRALHRNGTKVVLK